MQCNIKKRLSIVLLVGFLCSSTSLLFRYWRLARWLAPLDDSIVRSRVQPKSKQPHSSLIAGRRAVQQLPKFPKMDSLAKTKQVRDV